MNFMRNKIAGNIIPRYFVKLYAVNRNTSI